MSGLDIASRALTTNLAALQVIGNNIANVNTAGYSRQTVQLSSVEGQRFGNAYFGKGVELATVTRSYDELLTREAQLTKSTASSDALRYQRLKQLEDLFPLGDTGLGASLNKALNAWVDVASSPTDLTARNVAISSAQDFAQRLNDVTNSLDGLRVSAVQQVDSSLASINGLAKDLAALNQRIIEGTGSGAVPNDLLDQRDQLVNQLNQYIQTRTVTSDNGSMTVFIGGSIPLVLGAQAYEMARADKVVPKPSDAPADPLQVGIVLKRDGQPYTVADSLLRGGELNGLVQYINHDLGDTTNQLGRLALSFGVQMNAQHRLGIDLNGQMGGDLFSLGGGNLTSSNGQVTIAGLPEQGAQGSATASVSDPTQFVASDYEIRFDSTDPTKGVVLRLSDGKSSQFTVSGGQLSFASPSGPSNTLDGLQFSVSASSAGERYLLKPFADASRNIGVAVSLPQSLAAASPVLVQPTLKSGSGLGVQNYALTGVSLAAGGTVNPASLPAVDLSYDSATGSFKPPSPLPAGLSSVSVTPTSGYSPGNPMSIAVTTSTGDKFTYSLTLGGTPLNGDMVTIRPPNAGESMKQNPGNAKAMLALRDVPSFEGVNLSDGYVSVFSNVAAKVQSGKFAADFSETKATSAETARANVSGVNLDEEAAKLLQYQQSYQAAAKYLQTAQSTFDTLLGVFR